MKVSERFLSILSEECKLAPKDNFWIKKFYCSIIVHITIVNVINSYTIFDDCILFNGIKQWSDDIFYPKVYRSTSLWHVLKKTVLWPLFNTITQDINIMLYIPWWFQELVYNCELGNFQFTLFLTFFMAKAHGTFQGSFLTESMRGHF